MAISVFDLFKIGIGPSSSHTVGPMKAAYAFIRNLEKEGGLSSTQSIKVELFGSLGATGKGHGSDTAVLLGLQGESPDTVDTDAIPAMLAAIRDQRHIKLLGQHRIEFIESVHLILHKRKSLPYHPNGMIFYAYDSNANVLSKRAYYSIGGGFIVDEVAIEGGFTPPSPSTLPYPFTSAAELLALCKRHQLSLIHI